MFDWDRGNLDHIAEHGITQEEAEEAVTDPNLTLLWAGMREGEYRETFIGMTRQLRLLVVVVAERSEFLRVVTARKPRRDEVKAYTRR